MVDDECRYLHVDKFTHFNASQVFASLRKHF